MYLQPFMVSGEILFSFGKDAGADTLPESFVRISLPSRSSDVFCRDRELCVGGSGD